MKKVITIIILLAAAIGIGLLAQTHPGYVLIQVGHWSIQTSLWFALATLIIVLIIADLIVTLLNKLAQGVARISIWRQHYQRQSARQGLMHGLLAYSTEQYHQAQAYLQRYTKASEQPFITQWFLTKSLIAQHQPVDQAIQATQQAAHKKQRPYIYLLKAEHYIHQKQWQQAHQQLKQLPKKLAHTSQALKFKSLCLANQKHWEDLWPILQTLTPKLGNSLPEPFQTFQRQAFIRIATKHSKRYNHLKHYWQTLTPSNQTHPECAVAFIKQCQQLKPKLAPQWAKNWLDQRYSDQVLQAYCKLNGSNLQSRIDQLHEWHELYEQAAISYYLGYFYYQSHNQQQATHYAKLAWAQGEPKGLILLLLIYIEQQDLLTALDVLQQQFKTNHDSHSS